MAREKLGIILVKVENRKELNQKLLYTKEATKYSRSTLSVKMMIMMTTTMMMIMVNV
jgi:hypothetical protein